jgi:hypothetical protein
LAENRKSPEFPESASLEYIDQYGNHCMITWWPITYYHYEHRILGVPSSDVPLPDSRDRSPGEMPKTFKNVVEMLNKRALEVIGSTVPEIKERKRKDDGKPKRKRKRKSRAK